MPKIKQQIEELRERLTLGTSNGDTDDRIAEYLSLTLELLEYAGHKRGCKHILYVDGIHGSTYTRKDPRRKCTCKFDKVQATITRMGEGDENTD